MLHTIGIGQIRDDHQSKCFSCHPNRKLVPKKCLTNKQYERRKVHGKKAKPLNKQWREFGTCQCHVVDAFGRSNSMMHTHTQRRANPTGWNATDTGDLFTLNAMICNGLITCLYFGWFLSTRRTTQYAEVMWFLVDAVFWSEWMEGKKIVDLTFGIVTEK